jgi:hypothetical protein
MYFECGALAFIPDKSEPDTDRETDALTYTGVHCLDVIFKWGMLTLSTMLDNLIYNIHIHIVCMYIGCISHSRHVSK